MSNTCALTAMLKEKGFAVKTTADVRCENCGHLAASHTGKKKKSQCHHLSFNAFGDSQVRCQCTLLTLVVK